MIQLCRVDKCNKPRGNESTLCSMHRGRWRKHKSFDLPAKSPRICPKHGELKDSDFRIQDKRKIAKDGHTIISKMCRYCSNNNSKLWKLKTGYKPPVRPGRHKKRKYGITEDEYQIMLKDRNYKCDMCSKPETKILRGKQLTLVIDHCHKTNMVRGLLCWKCNAAYGLIYEDINTMKNMIKYKKAHG